MFIITYVGCNVSRLLATRQEPIIIAWTTTRYDWSQQRNHLQTKPAAVEPASTETVATCVAAAAAAALSLGPYSTACPDGLTTLDNALYQVSSANCGLKPGYSFHSGTIVACPIGESWLTGWLAGWKGNGCRMFAAAVLGLQI